jgi:hypothetical protein
VTICIVDDGGSLLFLQKGEGAGPNTVQFAQKARYAALYRRPSKAAADSLAKGNMAVLAFPEGFPNWGGRQGVYHSTRREARKDRGPMLSMSFLPTMPLITPGADVMFVPGFAQLG